MSSTPSFPSSPPSSAPFHSFFSLGLWNANGLRASVVHDVLSHALSVDVLLVTETWLTAGFFPTDWAQFHLYGKKLSNAHNRGSGGVTAFVSPSCSHQVVQLPSYNPYTLSLKVGSLNVHCAYLPPSLSTATVLSALRSIPLNKDTILCGDFNARLGSLVGDLVTTPRGTALAPWFEESGLSVLNASLAHGVKTFSTFRGNVELSSIIDLFLTNIGESALVSPSITVESDLSLSSDHRLMFFSFTYVVPPPDGSSTPDGSSASMAPRKLWNLSKLHKDGPRSKYYHQLRQLLSPLQATLLDLVDNPPSARPDIDALNDTFNDCLFTALDGSIGVKTGRPGYWKKFWTQEIEDAARERDRRYRRWRHSSGIDKIDRWGLYMEAKRKFRSLVQAAKRRSWKAFCSELERNFSKATAAIKRMKRNRESSSTYSHPDGPSASVAAMANHLSSVYSGSLLGSASRPAAPPSFDDSLPFSLSGVSLFDTDDIEASIKRLPTHKAPITSRRKC